MLCDAPSHVTSPPLPPPPPQVRKILDDLGGPKIKLIAQIDCADAIRNFDGINAASDGVMVSRINLGMDLGPSKARCDRCARSARGKWKGV